VARFATVDVLFEPRAVMVIVVLVGGRASFVALLRDYSAGVVVEIENAIVATEPPFMLF